MLAIEAMIRDMEEAIKIAFDGTATQRAAELATVVSNARSDFEKNTASIAARSHCSCTSGAPQTAAAS